MTAGEPIVLKNKNDRGWGKVLQRSQRVCVAIPVGISYDYKQFVMTGIVHIDLNRIYTYDKIYIPGGGMSDKHGLRNLYIGITAGYKFKL